MDVSKERRAARDHAVPAEQLAYARWLDWGTRIALAALIVTFIVYAAELVGPHVPFERLAQLWSLPVDQYRAAAAAPAGWGWLALARHGDYLNYVGIVLLGLVTIVCYARALPAFLRRGERALALVVAVEILILAAAATGIVGAPH